MPYSKSQSRKEAEINIKQIESTIRLLDNIDYLIQQLSLKISVVEISAILEEYLKTVFEDWISLMKQNDVKMNTLPNNIWLWSIMKSQKEYISDLIVSKDEIKLLKRLNSNRIIMNSINGDKNIKNILYPADIINDKKFPSSKNIKALFNRFGIDDIFKKIQIRFHRNMLLSIDAFLQKRNEIAHRYPSQDLTRQDLEEIIEHIRIFINYLDRIIFTHICECEKGTYSS